MIRTVLVLPVVFCVFLNTPAHTTEYWEPTGGPLGGDVRCLYIDPDDPSDVLVGLGSHAANTPYADGGGIFFSGDSGRHWERCPLQDVDVSDIAKGYGRFWAATYGWGIYTASDPRNSWQSVNVGLTELDCTSIVITDQRIVIGTMDGPFYSDPTTLNWQQGDLASDREIWDLAVAPWDSTFLLAASDSAVWLSRDGGLSWEYSGSGPDEYDMRSVVIGEDGRCWAGTGGGSNSPAWLYCSSDTGQTWNESFHFEDYYGEAVWTILALDDQILIGSGWRGSGEAFVFRSPDGESWERVMDNHYRSVRALSASPGESGYLLAGCESRGGVLRSVDDGETWAYSNSGLDAANVISIELADEVAGSILAGVGFSGAYSFTSDWGTSWTRMDSTFPSLYIRDFLVWPDDPDHFLAAAWNNVYETMDGGLTWQSEGLIAHNHGVDMSPLDLDVVYAAGEHGVFISHDGAETWTEADSSMASALRAYELAVDPRDGWHALVATTEHLFETRDAAASWDTLDVRFVRSISFHPYDSGRLYLGTCSGVSLSIDGGETFYTNTAGLPPLEVNVILPDPENPDVIWAGTPDGVYKSVDGGHVWAENNIGIENRDIRALMIPPSMREIYVGSYSGGIRRASISWVGTDGTIPSSDRFLRLQVKPFPNPCGAHLSIATFLNGQYGLDEQSPLRLSLHDMNGRLVRRSIHASLGLVDWDVSDIASGPYLLKAASRHADATVFITVLK